MNDILAMNTNHAVTSYSEW